MLVNNRRLDEINPNYRYTGKVDGYNTYLVEARENNTHKKKLNLDDALKDCEDFPNEYYNCDWKNTDKVVEDKNIISANNFYGLDYKA